ncbi:MAG: hypothetical protein F082_898 [bacterium F082]|nr:MAG: hypothetical protein F082_898 [bacterium F082]KWW28860.1 MAG: hypothetical protein AUK64_1471 [bacterium P201]
MKRIIPIVICAFMALASCQKKNAPLFRGDYSFKTSGSVTLEEIVPQGETGETFTVGLPNEIGQLEISTLDNGKDSVLVVMNTMGGEVVVTHAFCKDNEIFLRDFKKNTLLFTGDTITLKNEVRVHATGQMYEDNTLILNMTYDGEAATNNRDFKIHGDDIRMAAIRN